MITISDTVLDATLKNLLQRSLKFKLHNNVWRNGRVILYKQSGFFIEVTIQSKKRERFELPIPFDIVISCDKKKIYFDYRFSTFVNNNKELQSLIGKLLPDTRNRFYDTVLEIEIQEEKSE